MSLAACAMLFCCAVPGFYDPYLGLGAYWLDPPGGFLIGAAACCLGLSRGIRTIPWLVAFGVIGSLAVWARSVTGVYLFLVCAPILGVGIIRTATKSSTPWRTALKPLAAVGVPVFAIAGVFYVGHFEQLYYYYTVAGYGYKSTWDSLRFTWLALSQ